MAIKISRDACIKAQHITEETFMELENNTKKLDKEFEMQFLNLKDPPATEKYAQMREEIESLLHQIRNNFDDINDFCEETIKHFDEYVAR